LRLSVVSVLFALSLAASPAGAEIILDVRPTVRVASNEESTVRKVLAGAERDKASVVVAQEGERFFWTSRENRELIHSHAGGTHYFIEPVGGGYVKVVDLAFIDPKVKGPRYLVLEHVGIMVNTITYWGSTDTFGIE
jgi:hypothetical protein